MSDNTSSSRHRFTEIMAATIIQRAWRDWLHINNSNIDIHLCSTCDVPVPWYVLDDNNIDPDTDTDGVYCLDHMPNDRCQYAPTIGPWQWGNECCKPVHQSLIEEYDMTDTVFGGVGIRCKEHICYCMENGRDKVCLGCYNSTCRECGHGCECTD